MYKAIDIANWFIKKAIEEVKKDANNGYLTNMHVQKLLYFAQGHYLVRNNEKLFEEDIEAWQYGPLILEVYSQLPSGACAIMEPQSTVLELLQNDPKQLKIEKERTGKVDDYTNDFLNEIFDAYKKYSAIELANLSHEEAWFRAYRRGKRTVLDIDLIKKDFEKKYTLTEDFTKALEEAKSGTLVPYKNAKDFFNSLKG